MKGKLTIVYHMPGKDTCHFEPDDNTYAEQGGNDVTFAGMAMWCTNTKCEDPDVTVTLNDSGEHGSVKVEGAGTCGGVNHNISPAKALDASHIVVEGVSGTYGPYGP